jgi:hypothetical protein
VRFGACASAHPLPLFVISPVHDSDERGQVVISVVAV